MERLGKPRHRRAGRRLSEREVSESNLLLLLPLNMPFRDSSSLRINYGLAGNFARTDTERV